MGKWGDEAVTCSIPICHLLHIVYADGSAGLRMEPDLPAALAEAAEAERAGLWRAEQVTLGRDIVLEGDALQRELSAL
jgi:hypothetical protein